LKAEIKRTGVEEGRTESNGVCLRGVMMDAGDEEERKKTIE
jgi:hypothetical protein